MPPAVCQLQAPEHGRLEHLQPSPGLHGGVLFHSADVPGRRQLW